MRRASRPPRLRPQRARCRPPRTPKRSRTPPEGSDEVAAVPGADDARVLPSEPRATLAKPAERESPASPRSEDAVSRGTAVPGPPRPAGPLGPHLGQAAHSGTSPAEGSPSPAPTRGWGAPAPGRTAVVSAAPGPGPRLVCVTFAEEEFLLIFSLPRVLWPSLPPPPLLFICTHSYGFFFLK